MTNHHDVNDDDDDTPFDRDAIGMRLLRRIATFDQRWRRCVARSCRRARRCVDHEMICSAAPVVASLEDDAQMRAELRAMLDKRMAELGARSE